MSTPESSAELDRRLRELAALNESIRALASSLDLPQVLRTVLDRIKMLTQAEALSLLLYDPRRDELVFAATETLREHAVVGMHDAPAQGIAAWVVGSGRSALVVDPASDPRAAGGIDRVPGVVTRSLVAVPLRVGDRVAGVIEAANRYDGRPFDERDLARLEAVAATLECGGADAMSRDPAAIRRCLTTVSAAVPAQAVSLLLYDPAGRELVFNASRTLQPGVVDGIRMAADQGIAGWVARHREPLLLDDARNDPRHYPDIGRQTGLYPRTMICVPVMAKEKLLGVIQVINKLDGTPFDENELRLVQTLADHAAIAIENASLYRRAYVASITDDLTGLANTRHFNRMLPELIARGGPLSLLVLDLDAFKSVVDTYGHLVGSRTLTHIGHLIAGELRPGDIAARFGGDEFVVVLPGATTPAALDVAERIRSVIAATTTPETDAADISAVTASIGVATYPEHAVDAEALFRAADTAMYAVKRRQKNAVAVASGA